jgi:hypothetical protein
VDDRAIKELARSLQDDAPIDTSGLRRFLNLVLDDEELTKLVFDQYQAIPADTTFTVSKAEMIDRLVTAAVRQGTLPRLLAQMKERYAKQFAAFSEVISLGVMVPGTTTPPPQTEYDRRRLLESMIHSEFSLDEMKTMAFELGIDPDSLPARPSYFAPELIKYMERLGRLPRLLEVLQQLRPNVDWLDVYRPLPLSERPHYFPESASPHSK